MDSIHSHVPHYEPMVTSESLLTTGLTYALKLFKQVIQLNESNLAIQKEVDSLNLKIDKMGRLLESSHEEGKGEKRVLKASIIKKLVSRMAFIHEPFQNREVLQQQQFQYERQIETLRQLRGRQEEDLRRATCQIKKSFEQLPLSNSSLFKELPMIFEMESKIREILNLPYFFEKGKYQNLYDQKVLPLLKQAKQSIRQASFQYTVQAAAAKGKAAQAGLRALVNLAETQPVLQSNRISKQEIFLLPEEGAVFKRSEERAKEEEWIANQLFDLMSKQAAVGTFDIQQFSLEKFGIQIPLSIQERGFTLEMLSPPLLAAIRRKLSLNDRIILETYLSSNQMNPELENYQRMEREQWSLKLPKKKWKTTYFKKIQNLYLAHRLPTDAMIKSHSIEPMSFHQHILEETPLLQALNYLPTLRTSAQSFYLSPDLSQPHEKEAYELCEQFGWTYIDKKGKKQKADFKSIHQYFLEGELLQGIHPILSPFTFNLPAYFHLRTALSVHWKAISSTLLCLEDSGRIAELTDIQAKPFIKQMIIMCELQGYPTAREILLERLTPEAEFNAILTGEVQLLDLHADNLGVIPEPNDEFEKFKDYKFFLPPASSPISFKRLMIHYLEGKIHFYTIVNFKENDITTQKALKDLPELQKALNVRWKFVIFDTDLSLAEDNRLEFQYRDGWKEHLIPIRSVLLETSWKDRPLSDQTIQLLIQSDNRDLRVKNWIKKEDAPIYKKLSKATKLDLDRQLVPILKQYTLSDYRQNKEFTTLKILQDEFAQDLSNIKDSNYLKLWQTLERDLSLIRIRSHDTFESIAKVYHQDIQELKRLNSNLQFQPGKKIKIQYDLTSPSFEANSKRLLIGAQLFPRLTIRQQEALFERQQNRKKYLISYQKLSRSLFTGDILRNQIEKFLNESAIPLSSFEKRKFLKKLQHQRHLPKVNPLAAIHLKQELLKRCQPTYFNLLKVMYPLLADTYELTAAVYGKRKAGMKIGLYNSPLETLISKAKQAFLPGSWEHYLANQLEQQIVAIQEPSFFGYWD